MTLSPVTLQRLEDRAFGDDDGEVEGMLICECRQFIEHCGDHGPGRLTTAAGADQRECHEVLCSAAHHGAPRECRGDLRHAFAQAGAEQGGVQRDAVVVSDVDEPEDVGRDAPVVRPAGRALGLIADEVHPVRCHAEGGVGR